MSVGTVGSRKTGELVDKWAHDAGIVDDKHHVTGSARAKSGAQVHAERHRGETPGGAVKDTAIGVAKETLPEIVGHKLAHSGAVRAAGIIEGGGFVGGIAYLAYECLHELSAAEKKADEIRAAYDNDAVNVALARSLAFDPHFGELEAAKRPGVNQAGATLSQKLNEPGNPLKAAFQQRADDGFDAARRAYAATQHLPAADQPAATEKWMKDNGFGDQFQNDVAFGKGAEYFTWIRSDEAKHFGVDPKVEEARVNDRRMPAIPVRIGG